MSTEVLKCSCENKFQDKEYGKGYRVHNYMGNSKSQQYKLVKCTVCGTVKSINK